VYINVKSCLDSISLWPFLAFDSVLCPFFSLPSLRLSLTLSHSSPNVRYVLLSFYFPNPFSLFHIQSSPFTYKLSKSWTETLTVPLVTVQYIIIRFPHTVYSGQGPHVYIDYIESGSFFFLTSLIDSPLFSKSLFLSLYSFSLLIYHNCHRDAGRGLVHVLHPCCRHSLLQIRPTKDLCR
jgi:hypothetical protein